MVWPPKPSGSRPRSLPAAVEPHGEKRIDEMTRVVLFDRCRRSVVVIALFGAAVMGAACHSSNADPTLPPPGTINPDQFLFDRGTAAMGSKHYLEAREYFRKIVDSYPQSARRADAKLGMGDSYLNENRLDADILAINQYREFLQFFPLNPKADYAQYQICVGQSRQILSAERDQTATLEAVKQDQLFLDRYPASSYRPAVERLMRQAKDRASEHEFGIGLFNYRIHAYGGAMDRFKYLLAQDPEFTGRDRVYYYLAESMVAVKLEPAALPYYEKIVTEFPKSKFLEAANKRIAALKSK
jgi:outer membrane protein assembly factor BamD